MPTKIRSCAILAILLSWAMLSHVPETIVHAQAAGVVVGRLINGTDPKLVPSGVELDVIGLGGGMTVLKSTTTDSSGRFRIEGLPTGQPLMIRVSYHSVNYHGRFSFDATNRASVDIEIFEPTTSMKDIRAEDVRLGFQLSGEHIRGLETYSFVNQTKPRRSYMSMDGSFRFSKPAGISEPPRLSVQAPGSPMPLVQSPLESADGKSYYSLYGLRPGTTTFEVDYTLPYHDRAYTYTKRFYQDVASYQVGVIPKDMDVRGEGLTKIQVDEARNFAIYAGGPVKAGTELAWTFTGGTPVAMPEDDVHSGRTQIKPMPTFVARNALLLAPLFLMTFILVLWYAFNKVPDKQRKGQDPRTLELRSRRERLLNYLATLDHRHENEGLERREYVRQRDQAKRQLRRISMLLGKK